MGVVNNRQHAGAAQRLRKVSISGRHGRGASPQFSSIPATFCAVTASEGVERIEATKPRQCRRLAVARTFETSTMSRDKASARVARQLTGQRYILNYKGEVSL